MNNKSYVYAAKKLAESGYSLPNGTFDCKSDGNRYSFFSGVVTAVWDPGHFKAYPFGTWPDVPKAGDSK